MRSSRDSAATNDNHAPRPATCIVDEYEQYEVSQHAFFAGMKDRPVDYAALWLLMANLQCSISHHFVRWLASVIERIDEPRIACLLAKQLNDELGNGDFAGIHSVLLDRFVEGLAEKRPRAVKDDVLGPGRELLDAMAHVFGAPDPYQGVGALMVSEIFAKKMDRCVGDELRRQSALSPEVMHWLDLHEHLEVDHADDSRELAVLIPEQGPQLSAAWQGARAEWRALWGFLDDVHAAVAALP